MTVTFPAPFDPLASRAAPAPYNDRIQYRYGAALSPQVVTPILREADLGYLWRQADLLDEVREVDGHLQGVLGKREDRVAGTTWVLEAPPGTGDRGREITAFTTDALQGIEARGDLDRTLPDALAELQGALWHGRAVLETVWRGEGRWLLPAALGFVHARRLAYARDWRLHLWDQTGTATTIDGTGGGTPFGVFPGIALDRFPRGKFIVHRPRVRGGYPTREGLGRTCVWYSIFKRFGIRDLMAFAEWAGRGLRVGTWASGTKSPDGARATPEDVAVLQEMMEAWSSTVAITIPDTTTAQVTPTPSDNDLHETIVNVCNAEMSKAIAGGTLGTDAGTKGARSLGDVHLDNETMTARKDFASVWATLRRDLLRPLVELNFGRGAPVPLVRSPDLDPQEDPVQLATRAKTFVDMGGQLGQRTTREALGLPQPEDGESLLRLPPPPAPFAP